MRTPPHNGPEAGTVIAAQRGDRAALDALATAYLPLVYNIIGRAMNGHPDVDDVVQETMIRALRSLSDLRDPLAFRSWLVAIAVRQVRDSYRARVAQPPPLADMAEHLPAPDFEELTIQRLGLSGQRRETAEASRWLDDEDRSVLALWWQEAAGTLERGELADALGLPPAHAAVTVARMKDRLAASRMVVRALRRVPACSQLPAVTVGWDGEPSSLWRKRLTRHVRECPVCLPGPGEMVPAERLLIGLALVPVPAAAAMAARDITASLAGLSAKTARHGAAAHARMTAHAARTARAGRTEFVGRHATRRLPKSAASHAAGVTIQGKAVAVAVAIVTCAAGATAAAAYVNRGPGASPQALPTTSPVIRVTAPRPSPLASLPAYSVRPATAAPKPTQSPTPSPATPPPPAATVTTAQKGVSTWNFSGVSQSLAKSGASWYYNWAATPAGITAPAGVSFVPMIWGSGSVTTANLSQARQQGHILLGFNEPDNGGQANMTPAQALDLWPKLMATGMTLGSPAVAAGGDRPGGWLDQFMQGAKAKGYRVDFITLHWYGGNFTTTSAVSELRGYIQAVHDRYQVPIWLTEYALTDFSGSSPRFPTQGQQAAFVTASARMLASLPYVQRYAWFALPASAGSGTTGLFSPGAVATTVGRAFEAAGKATG
jgi:RNA polymerase sigma factor (sigma-70 family)